MAIPKVVWFSWLQGFDDPPILVRSCLESWRTQNPGWEVRTVSEDNLSDWSEVTFVGALEALGPAKRSDLLRLDLLRRHGGVWADATLLCHRPLDQWLPQVSSSGFFAFAKPGKDRLLSSWFLASDPGNELVENWYSDLRQYWARHPYRENGVSARLLERAFGRSVETSRHWFHPFVRDVLKIAPYYAIHYVFARLVARDSKSATLWSAVPHVTADLPHALADLGLDRALGPEVAAELDKLLASDTPVFKLNRRVEPNSGTVLDAVLARSGEGLR